MSRSPHWFPLIRSRSRRRPGNEVIAKNASSQNARSAIAASRDHLTETKFSDLILLANASLVAEPDFYRLAARLLGDSRHNGREVYGMARPFGQLLYCGWRFEGAGESRSGLQFSELIFARTAAALWGWMVRAKSSNGGACGRRTLLGSLKACRLASSQWRPAVAPIILAVFSKRKATRIG